MVTAILWQRAMAFALIVIAAGETGRTQTPDLTNTIFSRLKHVEHVGFSVDDRLGGYVINIYTAEEFAKYVELRKEYPAKMAEFRKLLDPLEKRYADAVSINPDKTKIEAIRMEISALKRKQPNYGTTDDQLGRVVLLGGDYLEIESAELPEYAQLIPFHKITRIVQKKTVAKELPGTAKDN